MQFVGTTTTTTTSQEGFKFSPPGDLNATERERETERATSSGSERDSSICWQIPMDDFYAISSFITKRHEMIPKLKKKEKQQKKKYTNILSRFKYIWGGENFANISY